MVRAHFDNSLHELENSLVKLSQLVERSLSNAFWSLKNQDLSLATQVKEDDDPIDELTDFIEQSALNLIRTQQPVANDLRILMSIIHISVELERIGDYAEGIANITSLIGNVPTLSILTSMVTMAELATTMVKNSILALANRDLELAQSVITSDEEVDSLYSSIFDELLNTMITDSATIQHATYFMWVSHDFERIGDRSENIAERVVYLITGNNRQ
jgi:phosphate transport system protein